MFGIRHLPSHPLILALISLVLLVGVAASSAFAQGDAASAICSASPIQFSTPPEARGIILTAFDRAALWVYDVVSGRRYPLPDTAPCTGNCHLSPDARRLAYFNPATNAYNAMRLDGSARALLLAGAGDVSWWSPDTLLVWTPANRAYLRPEAADERTPLPINGLLSVQPGGDYGVALRAEGDSFIREVVNVRTGETVFSLGVARSFYDAAAWSPDGSRLAYVAPTLDSSGFITAAQIYGLTADTIAAPQPLTQFTSADGILRIGGLKPDSLSWSPDGSRLAFWALRVDNRAAIYLLDTTTDTVTSYCGVSTTAHTPNPPRLVWSPDGAYLGFALDLPDDDYGALLFALDPAAGVFYALSDGVYPALGTPEIAVWGYGPADP